MSRFDDPARWERASAEFMLARVADEAEAYPLLDGPRSWDQDYSDQDPSSIPERDRDMARVPECLALDPAAGLLGWAWNWREPEGGAVHVYSEEERAAFAASRGLPSVAHVEPSAQAKPGTEAAS